MSIAIVELYLFEPVDENTHAVRRQHACFLGYNYNLDNIQTWFGVKTPEPPVTRIVSCSALPQSGYTNFYCPSHLSMTRAVMNMILISRNILRFMT